MRVTCSLLTMSRRVLTVGISGITNGGKTTLCKSLMKAFPACKLLSMDDYYLPEDNPRLQYVEEIGHSNYEDMSAIDFESMEKDMKDMREKMAAETEGNEPLVFLVEGILIFNYRPFLSIFDKKYFLTLTKEECWERRKHRQYDPPDPPGYFDVVVWPMYLKNLKEIQNQTDIVYMKGSSSREEMLEKVYQDMTDLMSKE